MSVNKEKLLNKINQDIRNVEEAIELVLGSRNYHVAGDLKQTGDYLRILKWDIEEGKYDNEKN